MAIIGFALNGVSVYPNFQSSAGVHKSGILECHFYEKLIKFTFKLIFYCSLFFYEYNFDPKYDRLRNGSLICQIEFLVFKWTSFLCKVKFTLLKSKFFPAKFFFCILEKGILAGKNLFFKRVNLLCKEGFFYLNPLFCDNFIRENSTVDNLIGQEVG
jgi:hypothetical protein